MTQELEESVPVFQVFKQNNRKKKIVTFIIKINLFTSILKLFQNAIVEKLLLAVVLVLGLRYLEFKKENGCTRESRHGIIIFSLFFLV